MKSNFHRTSVSGKALVVLGFIVLVAIKIFMLPLRIVWAMICAGGGAPSSDAENYYASQQYKQNHPKN